MQFWISFWVIVRVERGDAKRAVVLRNARAELVHDVRQVGRQICRLAGVFHNVE